ncbi:MAG: hypothetical protein WDZ59_03535 [Pirellulales bacterium]
MAEQHIPTLLTAGVAGLRHWSNGSRTGELDVYAASTIREAVATIRLLRFDLLVVGLDDVSLDAWELVHRVRTRWPYQRWIMASSKLGVNEEIQARCMGALLVLHEVPSEDWFVEFTASLRRRELSRRVRVSESAAAVAPIPQGPMIQV